jgi:antitoxin ParD1/3/4
MEISLSLPDSLKSWVEEQATTQGYASVAEYLQDLLRKQRQEQQHPLRKEIERKLLAAFDSGDPIPITPEFWQERHEKVAQRLDHQQRAEDA